MSQEITCKPEVPHPLDPADVWMKFQRDMMKYAMSIGNSINDAYWRTTYLYITAHGYDAPPRSLTPYRTEPLEKINPQAVKDLYPKKGGPLNTLSAVFDSVAFMENMKPEAPCYQRNDTQDWLAFHWKMICHMKNYKKDLQEGHQEAIRIYTEAPQYETVVDMEW